jgi:hypothetical protein
MFIFCISPIKVLATYFAGFDWESKAIVVNKKFIDCAKMIAQNVFAYFKI